MTYALGLFLVVAAVIGAGLYIAATLLRTLVLEFALLDVMERLDDDAPVRGTP